MSTCEICFSAIFVASSVHPHLIPRRVALNNDGRIMIIVTLLMDNHVNLGRIGRGLTLSPCHVTGGIYCNSTDGKERYSYAPISIWPIWDMVFKTHNRMSYLRNWAINLCQGKQEDLQVRTNPHRKRLLLPVTGKQSEIVFSIIIISDDDHCSPLIEMVCRCS